MNHTDQMISFQVVPSVKGLTEAVQGLRNVGFKQIKCSYDGRLIQVIAPRSLVEHVLGFSLVEKRRPRRVGMSERAVVNWVLPQGVVLPPTLQDVVAEILFPVPPNYHHSSKQPRQRPAKSDTLNPLSRGDFELSS